MIFYLVALAHKLSGKKFLGSTETAELCKLLTELDTRPNLMRTASGLHNTLAEHLNQQLNAVVEEELKINLAISTQPCSDLLRALQDRYVRHSSSKSD